MNDKSPFLSAFKQNQLIKTFLYLALICMLLGLAGLLSSAMLWLMSRYFLMKYGSILYPAKAHIYDSTAMALLALSCAAGHYFVAMLMKPLFESNREARAAWLLSAAAVAAGALFVGSTSSLKPTVLAALPVLLAYLIGGAAGWRVPPDKNLFRNLKF